MIILNRSTLAIAALITVLLAPAQFVLADDAGASNASDSDSASMSETSTDDTEENDGARTRSDTSKSSDGPMDNFSTGFPAGATEGGEFAPQNEASDAQSKSSETGSASGQQSNNSQKETVNSTKVEKVLAHNSSPKEALVIPVSRSDRRTDQDEALEAVSNGTVLPLKNVLREITDGDLGKVIDVKMKETLLGIVYKVKIRTERGEIKNLAVDGKTGKIIGKVGY